MPSERIFQCNSRGPEVVDIASNYGGNSRKGGGGDHQVGATMADLLAQPAPNPGVFSREQQDTVGKQLHRPFHPGERLPKSWTDFRVS